MSRVEKLVEDGEADMVAVGRALIADAAWVKKIEKGLSHELTPFSASALAEIV